ncbi:CGNR zinc finger domain-containing protein [Phytomonospora sp. NPDC050363]|uniref:CGNR zinc finger domain-containing protein n=1 Tax=Phytomonospora sp. NPDC050363 TaxID=3155642 RepID=UPI0033EA8444
MGQPGDRSPAPGALALVQDFVNTTDIEVGVDDMRTPADLTAFATAHGLPERDYTDDDVAICREAREALRDAAQAHAGVDLDDGGALDALLARGPLTVRIGPTGEASARPVEGLRGADALLAELAAAIVVSVAEGTWRRLKACAMHSCRWVYYDKSPSGRSRWCTMSICGSRAKMRAYRDRKG